MIAYIKLIRPVNLFIIALTQYLIAYAVIIPFLKVNGIENIYGHLDFALFVLAHIFIAAAGYAINDYYDLAADAINKPQKNMLLGRISPKKAYNLNFVLNVIGGLLAIYCSYKAGNYKLGFLPIVVSLALYFYALKYRRQLFTGNIVVAIIIAYSVLVVWLLYFFAIKSSPLQFASLIGSYGTISYFVIGFAVFAFLMTLIREIIKDAEDINGDKEAGYVSIPIRYGLSTTRKFLYIIIAVTMFLLGYVQFLLKDSYSLLTWYGFLIQALLLFLIFQVKKAKEIKGFHTASVFSKIIMVAGILSAQILYIILLS
jgi:4-hydroxybenzoate polyprenyltransferase